MTNLRVGVLVLVAAAAALALPSAAQADDEVRGCGGFVEVPKELQGQVDLASIEIVLTSPDGKSKYSTECAPHNGYYFLPVDDEGPVHLRVAAPPGWSFEPAVMEIEVDGRSDACSLGQDINFRFVGFEVRGRVQHNAAPTAAGPAGVVLRLLGAGSELAKTTTDAAGAFVFSRVLPGAYQVQPSESAFHISPREMEVEVLSDNAELSSPLLVVGYNVKASVVCEGEAVTGVTLLLTSPADTAFPAGADCGAVPDDAASHVPSPLVARCAAVSGEDGIFHLHNVPSGHYKLVPVYSFQGTTFDVAPTEMDVVVKTEMLVVEQPFEVRGFTARGRVLDHQQRVPIAGVSIAVNGAAVTETDADGTYLLPHVSAGEYTIEATKAGYEFPPLRTQLSAKAAQVRDIAASTYTLCGSVELAGDSQAVVTVALKTAEGKTLAEEAVEPAAGSFCFKVSPGSYVVEPKLAAEASEGGLALSPQSWPIEITTAPFNDILFVQLKQRIEGRVVCLAPPCPPKLGVWVQRAGGARTPAMVTTAAAGEGEGKGEETTFVAEELLPGPYKIGVDMSPFCWKAKVQEVVLERAPLQDVVFVQLGYKLKVATSHAANLTIQAVENGKPKVVESLRGKNIFCVGAPGAYSVEPSRECYRFEHDIYEFKTGEDSSVGIVATHAHIVGEVDAGQPCADIRVHVSEMGEDGQLQEVEAEVEMTTMDGLGEGKAKAKGGEEENEEGTEGEGEDGGDSASADPEAAAGAAAAGVGAAASRRVRFAVWVPVERQVVVGVSGCSLLFSPQTQAPVGGEDGGCRSLPTIFSGREGLYVTGTVTPAVAGIAIAVFESGAAPDSPPAATGVTDAAGRYRVGPLSDSTSYVASASSDKYAVRALDEPARSFKLERLGSIAVAIEDIHGNMLAGVLISVSGGRFRKNLASDSEGRVLLSSIAPGEYYVKPLLREYAFTPSAEMVAVGTDEEGEPDVRVEFRGRRVAFSCVGRVSSLAGRALEHVLVEATPTDSDAAVETAHTDAEGLFRLRGLAPGTTYRITAAGSERTLQIGDEDAEGVDFVVMPAANTADITGAVRGSGRPADLVVLLYREAAPAQAVQTVRVGPTGFFRLRDVARDETFFLQAGSARGGRMVSMEGVRCSSDSSVMHLEVQWGSGEEARAAAAEGAGQAERAAAAAPSSLLVQLEALVSVALVVALAVAGPGTLRRWAGRRDASS